MAQKLLRVVYISDNEITENLESEIDQILAIAQSSNLARGICGALIFNKGIFGQILEGPETDVEEIFERIQNDHRHSNIKVLELKPIERVSFDNWSMGFVGSEEKLISSFKHLKPQTEFDLNSLNADQMFNILNTLALNHELSEKVVAV